MHILIKTKKLSDDRSRSLILFKNDRHSLNIIYFFNRNLKSSFFLNKKKVSINIYAWYIFW